MEISDIEKEILSSLEEERVSTLKMITKRVLKAGHNTSKQAVWFALQKLMAGGFVEKVDRGVYKKI